MLQQRPQGLHEGGSFIVSNPISGEVGAAAWYRFVPLPHRGAGFQTPSAGRWVLQHGNVRTALSCDVSVSNPISGEVGAAAVPGCYGRRSQASRVSNPISGEVGAAAWDHRPDRVDSEYMFQTPSAGRWVLQLKNIGNLISLYSAFQTPSAGRWVLQQKAWHDRRDYWFRVSNPISGEVGAAADANCKGGWDDNDSFKPHQRGGGCCSVEGARAVYATAEFQTPSAGRWVLQLRPGFAPSLGHLVSNPISGEVGAAAIEEKSHEVDQQAGFKPHQRGGGCCSPSPPRVSRSMVLAFQTPSAGRWVLQLLYAGLRAEVEREFQTPSAGRWVLQRGC